MELTPGLTGGTIIYTEGEVPILLRMFEKRLSTYRAMCYGRGEASGFAGPEERTIASDEEGPRHFEENA
ncbi:MAG: hypothetical protein GWN84_13110 [Gammaproteobacteria bacterium]|nr:hypothetical protein [Gammaproteobacteria bacterium]NIR58160.1 hypothetical protein [Gammaproteobacteria bacterium]NIR88155.1 hypothetical protein [Gammaproteobacteria bacterium]